MYVNHNAGFNDQNISYLQSQITITAWVRIHVLSGSVSGSGSLCLFVFVGVVQNERAAGPLD